MNLKQAMQRGMVKQANDMIDRMIPAGGMSAGKVLAGLGAMDLDADGSNAFGAMDLDADGSNAFGSMDLDADGSNAFGEVDLEMIGSSAFGYADLETSAFSGLGKLKLGGFAKKLKTRIQAKAKAAKTVLRKVVGKKKEAVKKASNAVRKEALATNPIQKRAATQEKAMAVAEAANLTKIGEQLAKEAVDPKLTREEVKAAVLPEVMAMAEGAAESGTEIIQNIAETKTLPTTEQVRAAVTKGVAEAVTGAPMKFKTAPPARSWWSRLFGRRRKVAGVSGLGGATSAFLNIGDIETMQQEPLTGDIVKSWEPDDVYGEPDIF